MINFVGIKLQLMSKAISDLGDSVLKDTQYYSEPDTFVSSL